MNVLRKRNAEKDESIDSLNDKIRKINCETSDYERMVDSLRKDLK